MAPKQMWTTFFLMDKMYLFAVIVFSFLHTFLSNDSCAIATQVSTSCNFDRRLCKGWRQSNSDVFDWKRRKRPTPSSNTGPGGDHTSGSGHYMYIEASPQVAGDNAKLELSVSGNGELSCLEFYYHMYGDTMGTLTVFNGNSVVFSASGNHNNTWLKAEITMHLNGSVIFEGIRGTSDTGDLAIDDVSIGSGSCQRHTILPIPTFSTSSTFATSLPLVTTLTAKPTLSSETSRLNPSTGKPSSSFESSTLNPSTVKPSSSFETSTLNPSTVKPSPSFESSTLNPSTVKPSSSFESSTINPSTVKPLSSFESSTLSPSTVKPSLFCQSSTLTPPNVKTSLSSNPSMYSQSTAAPTSFFTSKQSTFNPSPAGSSYTPEPSLSSHGLPDSSKSTPTPKTPSLEETQESVLLEVKDLDINKWNEQMKDDFKRNVARMATDYCDANKTRCQFTSKSSHRKRSSSNMVFSSDMVHILPGYPKKSPDDPTISLLAFYLQLPQGFSNSVINKYVLKAIVESDVSSIEGSMSGTILSVQPLFITTDTIEKSYEESKPTVVIIAACVGGVLLLVIIVALVLACKKRNRTKKANNHVYINDAYLTGSGGQAIEMKCNNPTYSLGNVSDIKPEEQSYAAIKEPLVNSGP